MGLEHTPHIPVPQRLSLQALPGVLRDRLWLVVSVPLEPFSVVLRLPVARVGDKSLRCALDLSTMESAPCPMQELAAFYLSQRYPAGPSTPPDTKAGHLRLVTQQKKSLVVTLLDKTWPDAVHTTFEAVACCFTPKDDSFAGDPQFLDFICGPRTDITKSIQDMALQLSMLEDISDKKPSETRAS